MNLNAEEWQRALSNWPEVIKFNRKYGFRMRYWYVIFLSMNWRYLSRLYFHTLTEYVMKGLTHNYKNQNHEIMLTWTWVYYFRFKKEYRDFVFHNSFFAKIIIFGRNSHFSFKNRHFWLKNWSCSNKNLFLRCV